MTVESRADTAGADAEDDLTRPSEGPGPSHLTESTVCSEMDKAYDSPVYSVSYSALNSPRAATQRRACLKTAAMLDKAQCSECRGNH